MDQEMADFLALCLLCATPPKKHLLQHVGIFSPSGLSQKLMERISRHLPIVKIEDGMPQQVCQNCIDTLNLWNLFEANVRKGREILCKIKPVKTMTIKTEPEDPEDQTYWQQPAAVFIEESDIKTELIMEDPKIEDLNIKFEPDIYPVSDSQDTIAQNPVALSTVARNTLSQNPVTLSTVAPNTLSQNPVAVGTVARNTLSQNPVTVGTVARNTLSKNCVARNTLTHSSVAQKTLSTLKTTVIAPQMTTIAPQMTPIGPHTTTNVPASKTAPHREQIVPHKKKKRMIASLPAEIVHEPSTNKLSNDSANHEEEAEYTMVYCNICERFMAKSNFWFHLKAMHSLAWLKKDGEYIKCPMCPQKLLEQEVLSHFENQHKIPIKASFIKKGYNYNLRDLADKFALQESTSKPTVEADPLKVKCVHCGHSVKNVRDEMEVHVTIKHSGGKLLSCSICDQNLTKTGMVQPHMYLRRKEHCPYPKCMRIFKSTDELNFHLRNDHSRTILQPKNDIPPVVPNNDVLLKNGLPSTKVPPTG